MGKTMMRRAPLLLLEDDEKEIFEAVRVNVPSLKIVDNTAWRSVDDPPVHSSVDGVGDMLAIWHPGLRATLPVSVRENGKIDGPVVGRGLAQWLRSTQRVPGQLQAGRWAASFDSDDVEMKQFVADLWKVLHAHTTNRLLRGGAIELPPTRMDPLRDYRVGRSALAAARAGDIELVDGRVRLIPE